MITDIMDAVKSVIEEVSDAILLGPEIRHSNDMYPSPIGKRVRARVRVVFLSMAGRPSCLFKLLLDLRKTANARRARFSRQWWFTCSSTVTTSYGPLPRTGIPHQQKRNISVKAYRDTAAEITAFGGLYWGTDFNNAKPTSVGGKDETTRCRQLGIVEIRTPRSRSLCVYTKIVSFSMLDRQLRSSLRGGWKIGTHKSIQLLVSNRRSAIEASPSQHCLQVGGHVQATPYHECDKQVSLSMQCCQIPQFCKFKRG